MVAERAEQQDLDIDKALYFFDRRFDDDNTGYANLVFLSPNGPPIHCGIPLDSPNRREIVRKELTRHAATHDAYLGVANYATAPTGKKGENRTEAMIGHIRTLYCERDDHTLAATLPPPSITVETSVGRYQDYWFLDTPIDATTAKRYNGRIAVACGVGREAIDAARILRIPGAINRKPNRHGEIVQIADDTDFTYKLTDFDGLPDVAPRAAHQPHTGTKDAGETIREGGRNARLASFAGAMRKHGADGEMIFAAAMSFNEKHCVPPLDEKEVRGIAFGMERYAPAPGGATIDAETGEVREKLRFYTDKGKLMPDVAAEYFVRQGGICFVGIGDAAKTFLYNPEQGIYQEDTSNRLADRVRLAAAHGYSEPNQRSQIRRALREHGEVHHRELARDEETAEIVVENGVLNLETMELRPWSADEVFFRGVPVAWKTEVPTAAYNRLDAFLADVMPDPDDRSLFWEYVGSILYRKVFYRGILYFIGPHMSGKSSVYDLLLSVLGRGNFSSQNAQQMNEDPFGLSPLVDALANVCSDAGSDVRLLGTGNLKTLGTGEPVGINRKGQPYITARLHVPLLFSANDLPQFSGGDEAFRSRVLILMSGPTRPLGEQKPGIVGDLAGDADVRSAFLARAVEGASRLRARGNYLRSETMLARTAEMMTVNDEVRQFFTDEEYVKVTGSDTDSCAAAALYTAYKGWKAENDPAGRAMSAIGFGRKVSMLVADKAILGMTRPDDGMRGGNGKKYRGYRGAWLPTRDFAAGR